MIFGTHTVNIHILSLLDATFSLKLNGHGVIDNGVRGFYFGSIFEGYKRFWGDCNATVSYGPLIKNEGCIK